MPAPRPKANPIGDTFVHYLFASRGNEHILRSFINAVQENAGQPLVKETLVQNPFNAQTFRTEKRSIIDIKAFTENNRAFIIEFQVANHDAFANRALYYWAKTYSELLQEGESYKKLSPVIMIILTGFPLFPTLKKLHNTFRITAHDDPKCVFTDNLQVHTLELEDKKLGQIPTINEPLRQWLDFFHYSDKKSEAEMKTLLKDSPPEVGQAYDAYLRFNRDKKLRALEDARQQYLHDYNTDIQSAMEKGEAKGIAIGEAKGKAGAILTILETRFGKVSPTIQHAVTQTTDFSELDRLTTRAMKCKSLAEFTESVK